MGVDRDVGKNGEDLAEMQKQSSTKRIEAIVIDESWTKLCLVGVLKDPNGECAVFVQNSCCVWNLFRSPSFVGSVYALSHLHGGVDIEVLCPSLLWLLMCCYDFCSALLSDIMPCVAVMGCQRCCHKVEAVKCHEHCKLCKLGYIFFGAKLRRDMGRGACCGDKVKVVQRVAFASRVGWYWYCGGLDATGFSVGIDKEIEVEDARLGIGKEMRDEEQGAKRDEITKED
ncbi:hypothetical protein U1Q18_035610 [Sarracenia purpurea var. burkii]